MTQCFLTYRLGIFTQIRSLSILRRLTSIGEKAACVNVGVLTLRDRIRTIGAVCSSGPTERRRRRRSRRWSGRRSIRFSNTVFHAETMQTIVNDNHTRVIRSLTLFSHILDMPVKLFTFVFGHTMAELLMTFTFFDEFRTL